MRFILFVCVTPANHRYIINIYVLLRLLLPVMLTQKENEQQLFTTYDLKIDEAEHNDSGCYQ